MGDLPAHWTKHHLFDYFQQVGGFDIPGRYVCPLSHAYSNWPHNQYLAQYAAVLDAKTVLNQAYGFVTFAAPQEATGVMDLAQQEPLVTPEGFALRVNWARGSLPDWKRGGEGAAAPGDVPLHPRVRWDFLFVRIGIYIIAFCEL